MAVKLEVCVDNPAGLQAAIEGGADRIELCSALDVGGLTPSLGLMALAAKAPVPVYAMIRPRAGDFRFSRDDEAVMMTDIDAARSNGLAGVVIGAANADGVLDIALLLRLLAHAQGLGTTLHRVFDLVPDAERALDEAIDLGFERILTAGLHRTALEGLPVLESLVKHADGRIGIMPGSGVNADNAAHIINMTGARDIHASCREPVPVSDARSVEFGFSTPRQSRISVNMVRRLKNVIK